MGHSISMVLVACLTILEVAMGSDIPNINENANDTEVHTTTDGGITNRTQSFLATSTVTTVSSSLTATENSTTLTTILTSAVSNETIITTPATADRGTTSSVGTTSEKPFPRRTTSRIPKPVTVPTTSTTFMDTRINLTTAYNVSSTSDTSPKKGVDTFTAGILGSVVGVLAVLLFVVVCFTRGKRRKPCCSRNANSTPPEFQEVRSRNPILDIDKIAKQRSSVMIDLNNAHTSQPYSIPASPQPWDYESPVQNLIRSSGSTRSSGNSNRYVNPIYEIEQSDDEESNGVCVGADGTIYLRLGSIDSQPNIIIGDRGGDYAELDLSRPGPTPPHHLY